MAMQQRVKKHLCAAGLLSSIRNSFTYILDSSKGNATKYNLANCLMSGLAIFGLKSPSLLSFDKNKLKETTANNLKTLYGVKEVPSDSQLRQRLDDVDPKQLSRAYKSAFRSVQRGKQLPLFDFQGESYLISIDGTGFFHSESVHCDSCCEKHHRDGRVSYYHQIMSAVMVSPDHGCLLPMCIEPILQQDGSKKNDCERNAGKRLLENMRTMHPNLKITVLEDGLHSNAPHINLLKELKMSFIIGAKPKDHKYMFDWVKACKCNELKQTVEGRNITIRWQNEVPLNESNDKLMVNYLECEEEGIKKTTRFTWVTDIQITKENAYRLMKGARSRWRIENETFNTLKNQGYHFEHNFGHGYNNLSTVFANLMMLAFLVDQIQQLCCPLFQAAIKKEGSRRLLWERLRALFHEFLIDSWELLWAKIAFPEKFKAVRLCPDTS